MTELKPIETRLNDTEFVRIDRAPASHQERADNYHSVVVQSDKYRVIVCKGNIQWLLQRRVGERPAGVRWDSFKYFRSREALTRTSAGLHASDHGSWPELDRLPATFGGG